MSDTLVATVEGPLGTAEVYEITNTTAGGALEIEYEVRKGSEVQKFPALGAAYIVAGELSGSESIATAIQNLQLAREG